MRSTLSFGFAVVAPSLFGIEGGIIAVNVALYPILIVHATRDQKNPAQKALSIFL